MSGFEFNVDPWTRGSYHDFIRGIMNMWRMNPEDYDLDSDSLVMKGYTEFWCTYSLDQDYDWWVGEYIITPFIFNRIKNKIITKKEHGYGEFTFDFINDNGEIYKGSGYWNVTDGYFYYLKDEDFDKIKFPKIPDEIPDYVYLIHELKEIDDQFDCMEPEEQVEFVNKLKIGDQFKTKDGSKTITIVDSDNGKISIVYKENSK